MSLSRCLSVCAPIVLAMVIAVSPAQARPAFYEPPSPLPDGAPGDVLRAEPVRMKSFGFPVRDALAWRVLYLSRDAHDRPIAVSGTVIVPKKRDTATMPIVAYAAGTQGLGDQCAPSRTIATGAMYESPNIQQLLRRGYAVAMSDYEGLGTPGEHTYVVGKSAGRAVLDVVRAARNLPDAGLPDRQQVGVIGYSEGGNGAAWAGELQPSYAPDVPLAGVAAGGVPGDLVSVSETLNGSIFAAFMLAAAVGFNEAYPELDLESYLNPSGQRAYARGKRLCTAEMVAAFAFQSIGRLTTTNPLETPMWKARLEENRAGKVAPRAPVFMWHGRNDDLVSYPQAERLRGHYCALGVAVRWLPINGAEHVLGVVHGTPRAIAWLSARLEGAAPDAGNC